METTVQNGTDKVEQTPCNCNRPADHRWWCEIRPKPRTEPEQDWYFTFGSGHTHPVTGEGLGRRYVVLHGTADSTRHQMLAVFGKAWAFQYDQADGGRGTAGVEQFGLTEIDMPGGAR